MVFDSYDDDEYDDNHFLLIYDKIKGEEEKLVLDLDTVNKSCFGQVDNCFLIKNSI